MGLQACCVKTALQDGLPVKKNGDGTEGRFVQDRVGQVLAFRTQPIPLTSILSLTLVQRQGVVTSHVFSSNL